MAADNNAGEWPLIAQNATQIVDMRNVLARESAHNRVEV